MLCNINLTVVIINDRHVVSSRSTDLRGEQASFVFEVCAPPSHLYGETSGGTLRCLKRGIKLAKEFAPASHEVPSPPRLLVLKSRLLGIVFWHRNTKNRLIGRRLEWDWILFG